MSQAGMQIAARSRFLIDTHRRRVEQIRAMIVELDRTDAALAQDILAEEQKTGISNPTHFAYSPLAAAMAQRRKNINRSLDLLKAQLLAVESELQRAIDVADAGDGAEKLELAAARVESTDMTSQAA